MRLISLEFQGWGPYTSRQSIKFPKSRKVAILGTNGAGKTFILDALPAVLFKTVPNRKGGFYENFNGSDSFIDLTFELNGDTIRVKRLVNANSRTQKAYIWKNGESLNDGKDGSFTLEVQKLGINETAFLAAIYQSQNGTGNPLTMDVDSRIKLLSIILDLTRFDVDYAKAVEAYKSARQHLKTLEIQRAALACGKPNLVQLTSRELDVELEVDRVEKLLVDLDARIEEATQSVANAKANAQGIDELKREVDGLEVFIQNDENSIREYINRISKNLELLEMKPKIEEALSLIASERVSIVERDTRIQENQTKKQEYQKELSVWQDDKNLRMSSITSELISERKQLATYDSLLQEAQLYSWQNESRIESNIQQIINLTPSIEIIERVPCQGMEINNTCELLKNAHQNALKIEALETEKGILEKNKPELVYKIVDLQEKLDIAKRSVEEKETDLSKIMAETPPKDILQHINIMDELIQTLTEKNTLSNKAIRDNEEIAKHAVQLAGVEERIADYRNQQEPIQSRLDTNRIALAGKVSKIAEASDIEATIAAAATVKDSLTTQKKGIEYDKQQALNELSRIKSEQERAEKLEIDLNRFDSHITEASRNLSALAILREGLGPKGAKNVKIDAAGKAITERANRLIRIGLGPQFSLAINTLRELQSKDEDGNPEVRETLELKIINNDAAEEMLIENLSGGEKAMASLVFSLSLAVEQREACGLDIRCLILDEPSAGLSEENSIKYLQMLDAVLDETGIEQILFISHMKAMQTLADSIIVVTKGQEGQSSIVTVN